MASLSRKPNSPFWMAKFRDGVGRVVMRSTKKTSHRDAFKIAIAWEDAARKARAGELTQAASVKVLRDLMVQTTGETLRTPTTCETLESYLVACKTTGGAVSTIARYRPIFSRFLAHLGEVRSRASVASIAVVEVENWRNAELESGLSGQSANMALGVLRAALNSAKRQGYILHNPCDAVNDVGESSEERQPFSDEEVSTLLRSTADSNWQGAILVAVWTGLRLSDIASLTWGQVDLEAGTLTMTPAKTGKQLVQPLAPQLREFLGSLPRGVGKAPLFPNLAGRITGRNGGLSNEFARIMAAAKIGAAAGREKKGRGRRVRQKSFHSLRHSFVSRLANADVPADVRKALAGHDSDEAHARYTHLAFSKQSEALEKLSVLKGWQ